MISQNFIYLALAFHCVGACGYLVKLARGKIQPHLVTWSLWALAPIVAFIAQLDDGVGLPAMLTLFTGASPAVVVAISISKRNAIWKIEALDYFCGLLSIAGFAVWLTFRESAYSVGIAILADLLAALPTYRKSVRAPQSETWFNYACLAISAAITLGTIKTWTFTNYAFAMYLALLGTSLTTLLLVRNFQVNQQTVDKHQPRHQLPLTQEDAEPPIPRQPRAEAQLSVKQLSAAHNRTEPHLH